MVNGVESSALIHSSCMWAWHLRFMHNPSQGMCCVPVINSAQHSCSQSKVLFAVLTGACNGTEEIKDLTCFFLHVCQDRDTTFIVKVSVFV